jgi:DNA-directed RNA polymerase
MGKKDLGVTWQTPDGFLVHMFEQMTDIQRTKTQLAGMFVVRIGNYTNELNKRRQRNAVAPNFVHSMDAAHLRATIIKARAQGITSLALIHDDYGTHAADTDGLHKVIRECFVEQYSGVCPLERFKAWQEAILKEKLPPLPAKGKLDLTEVLNSEFFFG